MTLDRGAPTGFGAMLLRGGAPLVGGKVVRTVITLSVTAILARLLTPADFGIFATALIAVPLARAALEGLIDIPTIREDELDTDGLRNLLWAGLALMGLFSLLLLAGADALAGVLDSPDLAPALAYIAGLLMLQPFFTTAQAVLRRKHAFTGIAIAMPLSAVLFGAVAIGTALLGWGWRSLVIAELASQTVVILWLVARSRMPLAFPTRPSLRRATQSGGKTFVVSMQLWAWTNLDTLFASHALGPAGAGLYSRAYAVTTQAKEPFAILEQVLRQAFVAQRNQPEQHASSIVRKGLTVITLSSGFVAGSIFLLAEPIVLVLLGTQWTAVIAPLMLLVVSLPARIARGYLDSFAVARGSIDAMLRRNIILIAAMIVALILFAKMGLVAIALVVSLINIAALGFVGGAVDKAIAGTLGQRMLSFLPGHAVMLVMICASFGLSHVGTDVTTDWLLRAALCGFGGLAMIVLAPTRWLPERMVRYRQRVAFIGRKSS